MTLLKPFKTMHELQYLMYLQNATFTKPVTLDSQVLSDIANYEIWELINGMFEIRVLYSDDTTSYHRATTRDTLADAEAYVEEQVAYHTRKATGPKLVKSYTKK